MKVFQHTDRKPEEIMSDHLLNGSKMLAELCSTCGSPLFEIDGVRKCVVCLARENDLNTQQDDQIPQPTMINRTQTLLNNQLPQSSKTLTDMVLQLDSLVLLFIERIHKESDPDKCMSYMECIRIAVDTRDKLQNLK